jgi:hypothetical protein
MVYATNHDDVDAKHIERKQWGLHLLLLFFVVVCVFDPADQILGGKVFVFIGLWGVTLLNIFLRRDDPYLPPLLVAYVMLFIAIPLMSICVYYLNNGQQPFEGFAMLKAYLLVSLALVLVLNRIDLLPQLGAVLTVMASLVIILYAAILFEPDLFAWLRPLGEPSGILLLSRRSYGKDVDLLQVYFVTSPMLAISIAYYFDRAMTALGTRRKLFYSVVTAINVFGMLLAGTRNNILISLLLPLVLWPFYTRRPRFYLLCSFAAATLAALPLAGYLSAFFDPTELANSIKLAMLYDYFDLLGDPVTLLFGQGLGAYQIWSGKPFEQFYYVTELTYFEILRNFGLLGGIAMTIMLLFPVAKGVLSRRPKDISIAIAWLLYLVMCASNPNLFSSMGILILAILIANIFQGRNNRATSQPKVSRV